MSTIKTAVSLQESLFDRAEKLARRMQVSRSRLFAMALEDFIRRWENETLLDDINLAYDEASARDDSPPTGVIRRHMRRMIQDKW